MNSRITNQNENNCSFFSPSHFSLKDRLITLVALLAIGLVTIGILSFMNPSSLGPNAQQAIGIASLTTLGGELFLLLVLAYCLHKKRDLEPEPLPSPLTQDDDPIIKTNQPNETLPQNPAISVELETEDQEKKDPLPEPPVENQPNPSLLIIQRAVRVYKAQVLLKTLEEEKAKEMAAIKSQSLVRMHQSQKWAEILRTIDTDESPDEFGTKYNHLTCIQEDLNKVEEEVIELPYMVPQLFGLKHRQVLSLLSFETLQEWETICKTLKSLSIEERWNSQSRRLIEAFKIKVRNDIRKSPLPFTKMQEAQFAQLTGKTLIVRSSSNEDSKTNLNPGGNESKEGVPATKAALKEALAQVVASYFDLDSLKNRSLTQDPFQGLPLCSVLIMEQIVEQDNDPSPITSGVMMTHKQGWGPQENGRMAHVTASWGFGGGIVSGKTISDEWVLTDDKMYPTIRSKPVRLVTTHQGAKKISNETLLQTRPSLSPSQLDQLRLAAERLETLFGEPMDVEFVFKNDQLYIVQARSISASAASAPTFVDFSQLHVSIPRYRGNVIVSGLLSPRKVKHEEICFAKDLQEAKKRYLPGKTRLVIVHISESSDTHAALVFSSQDPPIPCMSLSQEDYQTCRKKYLKTFHFCPQSGMLILTERDLPQKNGLLFHPAQFPISFGNSPVSVQAKTCHPKILELERLLNHLPEEIGGHLDTIEQALEEIFTEISQREPQTHEMVEITNHLREAAAQEVTAMRQCAKKNASFRLSFHTGVLRKIVGQSGNQSLGAHSLSGLESATQIPHAIQEFMKNHSEIPTLCELAFLGRKAFDAATQDNWLAFLKQNRHLSAEILKQHFGLSDPLEFPLEELKEQLDRLDSLEMLTLWFSVHFNSKAEIPEFEVLMNTCRTAQGWNQKCFDFKMRTAQLTAQVEKIHSDEESTNCWNLLQDFSNEFLQFCSQHKERDLFQQLQISALFVDLVQLWDANIKVSLKSRHEKQIIENRIEKFKQFALHSAASGAIPPSYKDSFNDLFLWMKNKKSESKEFSVKHWLIPVSHYVTKIEDENQVLTVIHQNLLQAAKFGLDHLNLIPTRLAVAYALFKKTKTVQAINYKEDVGTYFSLSEEKASIKINIPLNVHSAVITLSQRKGEETIQIVALMRGSDNARSRHLPFYQVFSELFGIALEKYTILDADLEVVFSAKDEPQLELILKAIDQVNSMSIHFQDDLAALTDLLHQNPDASEEEEIAAQDQVLGVVWKWFKETGEIIIPGCKKTLGAYIEKKGLLSEVMQRVFDELNNKTGSYTKHFGRLVLKNFPEEGKNALWDNLIGEQGIGFYDIPDSYKKEIFQALILDNPEKALSYFVSNVSNSDLYTLYVEICKELIAAGDPKSTELTSFLEQITKKNREEKEKWNN